MDIFAGDKENRLKEYKSIPQLFSPMENSTCTVEGSLSNVQHNEEELTGLLECSGEIVGIDSNYGHIKSKDYKPEVKERKSNRGRKKKPKPVKTRKYQGDGSGFNSQISFTILGNVVRPKPLTPDKHSKNSVIVELLGKEGKYEKFVKEYKIKLFRNGKFTIPGVLTENLEDVINPLDKLCEYLESYFLEKIEIKSLFSVMRNYKFHLKDDKKIDIKKLQKYCVEHFQNLLNTRFEDIEGFIIDPIFEGIENSPNSVGWMEFLDATEVRNQDLCISAVEYKNHLKDSKNVKNLFVDFRKLLNQIKKIPTNEIYQRIINFANIVRDNHMINLSNNIIKKIIRFSLKEYLEDLEKFFVRSKDNLLSHIKYDPEKYPGFLIKVKTPNNAKKDKRTTIKIFPSGKINIDGANNRIESEFIYYWLNNLFHENNNFTYNISDQLNDGSDSEFSSESEED